MLKGMDSEVFLESCRLASEKESLHVRMPSHEEIESVKLQIRAERQARDAHRGPSHLRTYRRPKVCRTTYSQGHITLELWFAKQRPAWSTSRSRAETIFFGSLLKSAIISIASLRTSSPNLRSSSTQPRSIGAITGGVPHE
jgi:hypothetical protein